jgi:hypothetical protein
MRAIVYVLALFAAIKIGASEYLLRTSARDAVVMAYRERAIQACQRHAKTASPGLAAVLWSRPGEVKLLIGKPGLDVQFWQIDLHLWDARYRNPYLLLTPGDTKSGGHVCEYDVMHNAALFHKM